MSPDRVLVPMVYDLRCDGPVELSTRVKSTVYFSLRASVTSRNVIDDFPSVRRRKLQYYMGKMIAIISDWVVFPVINGVLCYGLQ